jgi:nitrogen fixation/metabolism regulation signal transduction histidine kinase
MKIQFKLILLGFVVIAILMAVVGFMHVRTSRNVSQSLEAVDRISDARATFVDPAVHILGHLSSLNERLLNNYLLYAKTGELPELMEADKQHFHSTPENKKNDNDDTTDSDHALDRTSVNEIPASNIVEFIHHEIDEHLEALDATADINPLVGEEIAHIAEELKTVQELHGPLNKITGEYFRVLQSLVAEEKQREITRQIEMQKAKLEESEEKKIIEQNEEQIEYEQIYREDVEEYINAEQYVLNIIRPEIIKVRVILENIDEHLDEEQIYTAKIVKDTIHEADAAASTATVMILTVGVIASVLLALGLGVFVSRSVARPLTSLRDVADAVAKGDLTKRAEVKGKDEIAQLASAFNAMTDNLLKASKLPKNILRSMTDSLFVVDTKGNITEVNQAALVVLGYKKEELVGKPVSKVFAKKISEQKNNKTKEKKG